MDNLLAHILVVDDDDGIRTLVKKYLIENKFQSQQQKAPKMPQKK